MCCANIVLCSWSISKVDKDFQRIFVGEGAVLTDTASQQNCKQVRWSEFCLILYLFHLKLNRMKLVRLFFYPLGSLFRTATDLIEFTLSTSHEIVFTIIHITHELLSPFYGVTFESSVLLVVLQRATRFCSMWSYYQTLPTRTRSPSLSLMWILFLLLTTVSGSCLVALGVWMSRWMLKFCMGLMLFTSY